MIVVAMPIYGSRGKKQALGWLVLGRAIDSIRWRQFLNLVHVPPGALDSLRSGTPCRNAAELPARPPNAAFSTAGIAPRLHFRPWFLLAAAAADLVAAGSWLLRLLRRMRATVHSGGGPPLEPLARSPTLFLPASSAHAGRRLVPACDRLQAVLDAHDAAYRFQPQIDMRTGRVAGVEAILCVPQSDGHRAADELVVDIETAGLGMAFAEHRLRTACREQSNWVRNIGHEFPIGVPVSHRTLANAAFIPFVKRILLEHALAPSYLELEVTESSFGVGASVKCTLFNARKVRDAGLTLAIDGFNAADVNLRLLTILPISKLRVDPWLLLRLNDGVANGLLFDALLGAARSLGVAVCVTGVCNPELLAAILEHARPLAQGSEVGKLRDAAEMFELLRGDGNDTVTLRPLLRAAAEFGTSATVTA